MKKSGLWVKKTDNTEFVDGWKLKYSRMKDNEFVVVTEPTNLGGQVHKLYWTSNTKKLTNGRVGFTVSGQDTSPLGQLLINEVIQNVNTKCSNVTKYVDILMVSL
jgi:hypothetical protein